MRATPTLLRRAASPSAFWVSAPQAQIRKSKAGNNNVVRTLNEQFKVVAFCGELRFAMEERRPLDRPRAHSRGTRSRPDYSARLCLISAGLPCQKCVGAPQVIQKNIRVPITIFGGASTQNRRWMDRCNDGRKALTVLKFAVGLRDLESRAKQ